MSVSLTNFVASLAPRSSRQLLLDALAQGWSKARFEQALEDYRWRRRSV